MDKKNSAFGNVEIEKNKFYRNKIHRPSKGRRY